MHSMVALIVAALTEHDRAPSLMEVQGYSALNVVLQSKIWDGIQFYFYTSLPYASYD